MDSDGKLTFKPNTTGEKMATAKKAKVRVSVKGGFGMEGAITPKKAPERAWSGSEGVTYQSQK